MPGPDSAGSLTENLIDLIESFGAPRPASKSLNELYQALANAITDFAPGGGAVATVSNVDGSITISPTIGNVVVSLSAAQVALINSKSPTASPTFTGIPQAPTALPLNDSGQLSTTAYTDLAVAVETARALAAEALKAAIASPTFTGTPAAPTAPLGTNTTQLATTAFVIANAGGGGGGAVTSVSNSDGSITISPSTGAVVVSLSGAIVTSIGNKAPIASPTFTGTVQAPTASPGTNSTIIATTAYTDLAVGVETTARTAADALKANIASPTFTGTPAGPTASPGTSTTQLATTAFVSTAIASTSFLIVANVQTGPYTLLSTDYLKCVEMNNTAQTAVTCPASIFTAGQSLEVCGINLGQVRIVPASGFTLDTAGGANVLRTRWSTASLRFRGGGEGVLSGDLINLIALINQAFAFNASSGIITATTPAVTAGNALVATVEVFTATTNTSGTITDTAGGTWAALTTPSSDALTVQHQYFICNNPAAGVHAVTFTPSGSPGGAQLVVSEWSGGPFTFDQQLTQAFASGTTGTTLALTPTHFNELIIASGSSDGTSSTMLSPSSGFIPLVTQVVHSNNPSAYLLGANIAPVSCSWSVSPADSGTASILALIGT